MSNINIGLFGFGVVGEGIYKVLNKKPQLAAHIKKVVIKQKDKERNAPRRLFTTHSDTVLEDPSIDLIVELIDDAKAALDISLKAMNNKKSVISANKKMVAEHLELLKETAEKNNVSFLYEAAVCGSVPVIRNLEEYYDNDLIDSISGIINGSTNYILTQMAKNNWTYRHAVQEAQKLGFAESDPSLDVGGWDARDKLKILAVHAFGKSLADDQIFVQGIENLATEDFKYAKEKKYVIKLIAECRLDQKGHLIEASVCPSFLPRFHPLRLTDNEYNALLIGGELSDQQFLYGKGAGRYPTSSAVLSDISAYRYNYKYAYKKSISKVRESMKTSSLYYIRSNEAVIKDISKELKAYEKHYSNDSAYCIVRADQEGLRTLKKDYTFSLIKVPDVNLY